MSGFGMSYMIQGASKGLDEVEQRTLRREDQDYERTRRGREGVEFDNSQKDRVRRLEREDVTNKRVDDQYAIAEKADARQREVMEAVRQWQLSGDPTSIVAASNKYTRDGVKHSIVRNEDGTYDVFGDVDGKVAKKTLSEDDIGQYMMVLAAQDPFAQVEKQNDAKASAAEKAGDRAHAERLVRIKGEEDRKGGARTATQEAALERWYNERYADIDDKEAAGEIDGDTAKSMRARADERYQASTVRLQRAPTDVEPPPGDSTASGDVTTPKTQEEYDALPPGAMFIDPDDGKQYQKPAATDGAAASAPAAEAAPTEPAPKEPAKEPAPKLAREPESDLSPAEKLVAEQDTVRKKTKETETARAKKRADDKIKGEKAAADKVKSRKSESAKAKRLRDLTPKEINAMSIDEIKTLADDAVTNGDKYAKYGTSVQLERNRKLLLDRVRSGK